VTREGGHSQNKCSSVHSQCSCGFRACFICSPDRSRAYTGGALGMQNRRTRILQNTRDGGDRNPTRAECPGYGVRVTDRNIPQPSVTTVTDRD